MRHFGILNVNKPPGCTSRDVVNHVERLCRPAKVGHAGTLDPLATGVLVICVGQATRLIHNVQQMRKFYRASFLLGRRSESDDAEGQITMLQNAPVPIRAAIERTLPRFLGRIAQRPPAYSAIKTAGQRAYKLARRGVVLELAPRMVSIYDLRITEYEYPALTLHVECGSGTYVRALGRDLAVALGTAAIMSALERSAIGGFRIGQAASLSELTATSLPQQMQSPLTAVAHLPQVKLNIAQLTEIRHGRPIQLPPQGTAGASPDLSEEWAALTEDGQLAAILNQKHPGQLWPEKVLI